MNGINIIAGELMESRSDFYDVMDEAMTKPVEIKSFHYYGDRIIIIVKGHYVNLDTLREQYIPQGYVCRGYKYRGNDVFEVKYTKGVLV